MHLMEQVSEVQMRLADIAEHQLDISEIIHFINQAQYVVNEELYDLDSQLYLTSANINTTNGTASYTVPEDIGQIELVLYDATNAGGNFPQANQVKLSDLAGVRGPLQSTLKAGTAIQPKCWLLGRTLWVNPTPTASVTAGIVIYYKPTPRELSINKIKAGLTTSSAGAAGGGTVVATALSASPFPNRDNNWNGSMIVVQSGTSLNERQIVSTFTASSGTCTMRTAFLTQIANAVSFDIFDHSVIDPRFHHHINALAAANAALKAKKGDLYTALMQQYDAGMVRLRASRKDVVDVKTFDSEQVSRENR